MNKLDHIYKPMKVKTPINRPTNRLIATMLFNLKIENCRLNIVRLNETVYLIIHGAIDYIFISRLVDCFPIKTV